MLDEGVAPTLLQLLQCAICGVKGQGNDSGATSASPGKQKAKKDKDIKIKMVDELDGSGGLKKEATEEVRPFDEGLCQELVRQLHTTLVPQLFVKFVRTYLLDSNSSSNRWMAHSLVLSIYRWVTPVMVLLFTHRDNSEIK